MIEKSKLVVGDRLPPEQTLASCLGVGRSTIREALKAWQSMGIMTRNMMGIPFLCTVIWPVHHRWRYAKSGAAHAGNFEHG